MSNITALVEIALRNYPSLYRSRLDVLQAMFGTSNYAVDPETGDLRPEYPTEDRSDAEVYYDTTNPEYQSVEYRRDNAEYKFVRENAAEIAQSSVHDKMRHTSDLRVPYYTNSMTKVESPDRLSEDTRAALRELLNHYEDEYQHSRHLADSDDIPMCTRSWHLENPWIKRSFESAFAVHQWLTGETIEVTRFKRHEWFETTGKAMIQEMLAKNS